MAAAKDLHHDARRNAENADRRARHLRWLSTTLGFLATALAALAAVTVIPQNSVAAVTGISAGLSEGDRAGPACRPAPARGRASPVGRFEPRDADRHIEAWIAQAMAADVERSWTRAELAEQVRDEHSTFTWLLEPMIERAGFDIVEADYCASVFARYVSKKR